MKGNTCRRQVSVAAIHTAPPPRLVMSLTAPFDAGNLLETRVLRDFVVVVSAVPRSRVVVRVIAARLATHFVGRSGSVASSYVKQEKLKF